jgi:hypothetical protein
LLPCNDAVQASTPGVLFDAPDLLKDSNSATEAREDLAASKPVMPLKLYIESGSAFSNTDFSHITMNKFFTLFVCLLCVLYSTHSFSQGTTEKKRPLYRALVHTVDKNIYRGAVYALNDSTISLTWVRLAKKNQVPGEQELLNIPVSSIKQIKFQKAGAYGRGFVFGALLGIVGGVIIGEVADKLCRSAYGCMEFVDPGAVGGIMGFIGGSAIGLAIASKNQKFKINGSRQYYNALKESMQPYIYIPYAELPSVKASAGE